MSTTSVGSYLSQGYVLKTNLSANTSMRAPGVPQSIFAMECVMDNLADAMGMSPVDIRAANFLTTVRKGARCSWL